MITVAERAWNLWWLLNVKAGLSEKGDAPPPVWFTPLKAEDKEVAIHDYYESRTLTLQDVEPRGIPLVRRKVPCLWSPSRQFWRWANLVAEKSEGR
ncbi:MAG: aldehyde ferredoxin oxidoreductase C-terminal domain-containing protein [Chloroflexi bacterium]|nr:aldehyde ferredoxin oxidoreductase C-terminal domain-containing protein [Chloroflexota bacterium]